MINNDYCNKINTEYEAIKRTVLGANPPSTSLSTTTSTITATKPTKEIEKSLDAKLNDIIENLKDLDENPAPIVNNVSVQRHHLVQNQQIRISPASSSQTLPATAGFALPASSSNIATSVVLNSSYYDNLNNLNNANDQSTSAAIHRRRNIDQLESQIESLISGASVQSSESEKSDEMIKLIESITNTMNQVPAIGGDRLDELKVNVVPSSIESTRNSLIENSPSGSVRSNKTISPNANVMKSPQNNNDILNDIIMQVIEAQNRTETLDKLDDAHLKKDLLTGNLLSTSNENIIRLEDDSSFIEIGDLLIPASRDDDISKLEIAVSNNEIESEVIY